MGWVCTTVAPTYQLVSYSPRRSHRFCRGLPAADAARGVRPLLLLRFLRPQPHHFGEDPAVGVTVTVVAGVVILGVRAVAADAVHDRARRGRQAAGRRGRGRGAMLHVTTAKEVKKSW